MVMIEIRWHGRGGQGAVTASEVVAAASILEGRFALAFPEFGAERRGAPVRAYTRISDQPVLPRTPVTRPDIVVILDYSLIKPEYVKGLKKGGSVIVNTPLPPDRVAKLLHLKGGYKLATVDATKLAKEILGRPIVNTAMIGALAKATGLIKLETAKRVIKDKFPGRIGEANARLIDLAYNNTVVKELVEEVTIA